MFTKTISYLTFICVLTWVFLFHSAPAFANAGSVMTTMNYNFRVLPTAVAWFSYLTGIGFTAVGLLKMRDYVDNPSQAPVKVALAYLFIGAMLVVLPYAVNVATESVGGASSGVSRPALYN